MRTAWVLVKHTYFGFTRHDDLQLAAAISYYVLFSIVPLAIFTVSVFGFVMNSDHVREAIVNRILDAVPLSQTEGRSSVQNALDSVKRVSGPVAVFGLLGTLWTASSVFASIRKSLNRVFGVDEHRPFVRQKLVDFAQVGVLGSILIGSMAATGILRIVRSANPVSAGPLAYRSPVWEVPSILLPAALSFLTFALLYRIVPAARPRWRDAVPGALLATLLFEAMKNLFAVYVENFNNFDVIYGSLAGALLFLFYTYASSSVLLIGAELTNVLRRYHAGDFRGETHPARADVPGGSRALRAVRNLFARQ